MCFVVGLGQEMTPESEVGCAENMINTMVFERFHFFTCLVNWMISNRLLDVLFGSFLGTLGLLFLICEGLGVGLKFYDFLGIPWTDPG